MTPETREAIASILEAVVRDGLPNPRDLDVALDAIDEYTKAEVEAARREGAEAMRAAVIEYLTGVADRCDGIGGSETYRERGKFVRGLIDPHIRALPLSAVAAAKERDACAQNTDFSIKGRVPT